MANETEYRVERDSLGEMRVPREALYAAQTQRAVENFPISGIRFPRRFIAAMGIIKKAAAQTKDLDSFKDAFGTVTKACGSCHETYRVKKG